MTTDLFTAILGQRTASDVVAEFKLAASDVNTFIDGAIAEAVAQGLDADEDDLDGFREDAREALVPIAAAASLVR